ncbi:MAG: aminotransferase class III-fold pyridoxal phosphate-dependent enzyme [Alphaproteobacteria bacterium]|nr:aminotransferase class III-fold pyridoxal phosphate-dependent enzyme [Alphaproteobacteria bacterium]
MNLQSTRNYDLQAAVLEAEQRFATANPKSAANYQAACQVMPGGNTRTVLFYAPFPLTIARAEGCTVTDLDGHAYMDFLGEYTAGLYGHSHPVIKKAILEGLERGIVLGGQNETEVKLATLVAKRWGMDRLRFTNSGTEGNLLALNAARAFTKKPKIMGFDGGYHGGVLSMRDGGSPTNAPYDIVLGKYNDIADSKALIEKHAKELACVILEPMMGGAGCLPADKAFLEMLRAETTKHGVLLILDEVVTSRLAPGGAQEIYGVKPDLMSFGKYIGGGLSFGGFGGKAEIMDNFDPRRKDAWPHAGTFNQNQLTMSAGYAGLSQVYTPEVCIAFNKRGDQFRARLQELAKKSGLPIVITGMGSTQTVHFTRLSEVRTPTDAAKGNSLGKDLLQLDMMSRGIYMTRRGMINMSLPMGDKEFDAYAKAFESFLTERAGVLDKI